MCIALAPERFFQYFLIMMDVRVCGWFCQSWVEDSAGFLAYHCHPHASHSLNHLMSFSQSVIRVFICVFFLHDGSKNSWSGFSVLHVQGWMLKRVRPGLNVHAEGRGIKGFNTQMNRTRCKGQIYFLCYCGGHTLFSLVERKWQSVFWTVHPESQHNKSAWTHRNHCRLSFKEYFVCMQYII